MIAAQSIGEPGTQLTMRTFHIGGAAQISEQSFIESNFDGKIVIKTKGKNAVVKNTDGDWIAMGRSIVIAVTDPDGTERAVHRIQNGARLRVEDGQDIKRGQRIAEWDPYTRPILTEAEGTVAFEDLVEGQSMSESVDEATGIAKRVVTDWRTSSRAADLKPAMVIKGKDGKVQKLARGGDARYLLAVDAILSVDLGGQGQAGRRDRAYPDRKRQDPRHHRRSAAGGGAVRGAQAEGRGGDRRDVRHRAVRQGLQEQAPAQHRAEREGRGARGISHSRRASTSICRTATPSRRAITSSKAIRRRTTSWRSRASRSWRTISSTRSRRSIGSRACRSTTSTSR